MKNLCKEGRQTILDSASAIMDSDSVFQLASVLADHAVSCEKCADRLLAVGICHMVEQEMQRRLKIQVGNKSPAN